MTPTQRPADASGAAGRDLQPVIGHDLRPARSDQVGPETSGTTKVTER
jgi:hypothetical protein